MDNMLPQENPIKIKQYFSSFGETQYISRNPIPPKINDTICTYFLLIFLLEVMKVNSRAKAIDDKPYIPIAEPTALEDF